MLAAAAASLALFAPGAGAQTLGMVTPLNCFSTSAVTGCTSFPGLNGDGALSSDVTVSPDGRSAYAVMSESTLVQFAVGGDGSLSYVTCIGDETLGGANPCPVAAPGIRQGGGGSGRATVSPDGAHVYVPGYTSDAVAVFRRDREGPALGRLTSEGCLATTGVATCDAVAGTTRGQSPGLDGALAVQLSSDGANVYVAAIGSKTVVAFKRDVDGPAFGRLTPDGCLANTGVATCDAVVGTTKGRAPGLSAPDGLAISPDQASVYVTDAFGALAVLTRDTAGVTAGRLSSDGCLAAPGSATCDAVPGSTKGRAVGIGNAQEPVVSPDGRNVYVANQASIAVLKRDGTGPTPGRLVDDGCLARTGVTICDGVAGSTSGQAPTANASGIALAPDGANLYSTDFSGSRIGSFVRRADGGLTYDGCLANTGTTTCDAGPGATRGQAPGILRPSGVTVAPNGRSLYVASDNPGSVVAFSRFVPAPPEPPIPPSAGGPPPTPPGPAGGATGRRAPRSVSSTVRPRQDLRGPVRVVVTGKVNLPAGGTASQLCATTPRGRVSVQTKVGSKTISTRRVALRANCTFSVRVAFTSRSRFGRATRLKVTARFLGNSRLSPRAASPKYVRIRR